MFMYLYCGLCLYHSHSGQSSGLIFSPNYLPYFCFKFPDITRGRPEIRCSQAKANPLLP